MRSSGASEKRRAQLTTWAIASGVWLAIGGLIFIAAVSSIAGGVSGGSRSGECEAASTGSSHRNSFRRVASGSA